MTSIADFAGWPEVLMHLLERHDLTHDQARAAMTAILGGSATPAQLAAFVVALKAKGESGEEM